MFPARPGDAPYTPDQELSARLYSQLSDGTKSGLNELAWRISGFGTGHPSHEKGGMLFFIIFYQGGDMVQALLALPALGQKENTELFIKAMLKQAPQEGFPDFEAFTDWYQEFQFDFEAGWKQFTAQ